MLDQQQQQRWQQQIVLCDGIPLILWTVPFVFMNSSIYLSLTAIFRWSRNWHRFSNPENSGLKVGCQRVTEPVLSPLLHKRLADGSSNAITPQM